MHPILCRVLAQRGLHDAKAARKFLHPDINDLHNPFLMKDMRLAVDRLAEAVRRRERILLYGDYDVDGTTSVAMMYAFLQRFYEKHIDYYLPDRDKEGYGVSIAGVEYARETECRLVIAMDCGVKAHEPISLAKTYGIDFIVCDHHLPDGELPPAYAILDPKRLDCTYPFKELSGCGIAFKLAQAFAMDNDLPAEELEPLLDLVTLSIACDVVPMVDENRTMAYFGLEMINRHPRLGLWALINRSVRRYPLMISDLVYGLGPLINAAGRLADAREAVRMMLANDREAALDAADHLVVRNKKRREVDQHAAEAARSMLESQPNWRERKSAVLFSAEWHKGIIGITASRMAEWYHKPTVILTESDGRAVGSARSVPGFDLYGALLQCQDLFLSFGGHDYAAGMQMPLDRVGEFAERFEQIVMTEMRPETAHPEIEICSEIELAQITPQFWQSLKRFAPFGPHNMNPVFCVRNVKDTGKSRILEHNHLRICVRQGEGPIMTGVGFGLALRYPEIKNKPFDLVFNLREEQWQGQTYLSLQVKDLG